MQLATGTSEHCGLHTASAAAAVAALSCIPQVACRLSLVHTCFLQLVEIMPCLDTLPELLGRPYGFDDDDAEHAAGQGADDMDMDGPGSVAAAGPGSTAQQQQQQQGPFTLEQLLQRVQVRGLAAGTVAEGTGACRWGCAAEARPNRCRCNCNAAAVCSQLC